MASTHIRFLPKIKKRIQKMNDKDEMLLLANPKKLQRAQSATNVGGPEGSLYPVRNCFQILEATCIKDPVVQTYPKEFSEFIKRNTPEIIAGFKRSLQK